MQAIEVHCFQPGRFGQRRAGEQVQHLVQAETRDRQAQQVHEHIGQRLSCQWAAVGQRVGNVLLLAAAAAEHRLQVRHIGIDVRRQHRDLARLQRRVEARVLQQASQLVVQHLQLAQPGVAGMHLQAGVVAAQPIAQLARGQCAAVEQIALQAMQQAVGQAAFVQGRPGVFLRIRIRGNLAGRVHHLVAAQHRHEVAAGRTPGFQQAVLTSRFTEGIGRAAAQALGQRLQVTPVRLHRSGHIEVQLAHPRLGGHHPQHVGGDVERRERGHARWQALWQRLAGALEAIQVRLDAARAVVAAMGDGAPEDRLRVGRVGAGLPAQQPVAAPGLVLLEHRRQFTGQCPRLQGVAAGKIGLQRAHRWLRQQRRVAQCLVQLPVQARGVQVVAFARHIGIECTGNEFARGQELEVGGHAIFGSECRLQPTPHRHLRDQHHLRREQRLAWNRHTHVARQQRSQHVQGVGMVEAEIAARVTHHAQCAARQAVFNGRPVAGTDCSALPADCPGLARVVPCHNTGPSSLLMFSRRARSFDV
ncbi:hypothetical protein PAERUG_E15_London_28_01_14_08376 [Pseudomonas aeruginosa]|nr:hypothetical protein PAERUG_E15_London_28_01_14_08376 [Pseudomonas aeruginosa]